MTSKLILFSLILMFIVFAGCPAQKKQDAKPVGEGKTTQPEEKTRSLATAPPADECDPWAVDIVSTGEKIIIEVRRSDSLRDFTSCNFEFGISDNSQMTGSLLDQDRSFTSLPATYEFTEFPSGTPLVFGSVYWVNAVVSGEKNEILYEVMPIPVVNVPEGIDDQVIRYKNGKLYTAGYFTGCIDFDPGEGEAVLIAKHRDCYLAVYDDQGNYIWAGSWGGDKEDQVRDIAIDDAGNVYLTGFVQGSANMDPDPNRDNIVTVTGDRDSFVMKLAFDNAGNSYTLAKHVIITGTEIFDEGANITIDENGDVFASGMFEGTLNVNSNLIAQGGTDVYIARYNSNLDYLDSFKIGDDNKSERERDRLIIVRNGETRIYTTGSTTFGGNKAAYLKVMRLTGGTIGGVPDINTYGIWDEGEELNEIAGSWDVYVRGILQERSGCKIWSGKFNSANNSLPLSYGGSTPCPSSGSITLNQNKLFCTGIPPDKSTDTTLEIRDSVTGKIINTITCDDSVWNYGENVYLDSNKAYIVGHQIDKINGAILGMFFAVIDTTLESNQCVVYKVLPDVSSGS
jgi:hypothetical protein